MAEPTIKIKRSSVAGKIPTTANLALGELAINTYDGKIFLEQDQGGVGVGTTVITVNPWNVGLGSTAYDLNFTAGSVGIGTTNPGSKLTVNGAVQIQQDSGSNNRLIFRGQPGSSYRWNIDNYDSSNDFRIFREDDATSANGSVAVSISTTGTVTATKFSGDGSLLTNLPSGGGGGSSSQWVTTAAGIHTLSNVGIGTTNPTSRLTVSGDASITGILTADQVYTSNNGNGQNIRIGDDFWLGDVNLADTTRFSGAQDSTRAFIIFGSSDAVALGRTGTGPLYYGGNFNVAGVSTLGVTSTTNLTTQELYVSGITTFAGNVTLGDNTSDDITVSGEFVSSLVPNATNSYDLGSSGQRWRDIYASNSILLGSTITFNTSGINVSGTTTTTTLEVDGQVLSGYATSTTTATTANQSIFSGLSTSTYRSAEFIIQAVEGTNYQVEKLLVIHNGTTTYNSEYGNITSGNLVANFDTDISGGNIRLLVTPASANSTTYKISYTAIRV